MKKILINGNMGYIGPVLGRHLRQVWPEVEIIGFDSAFFAGCLTDPNHFPEVVINKQYFGDVRNFPRQILEGVDAVVQLAAVSNDPMGKVFEGPTHEINNDAAIKIAQMAKEAGVKHYVYASSCSVYGAGGEAAKTEMDELNPQTAYAISKINTEKGLKEIADDNFLITCLRFATACGFSPRIRLDLVLNDFVASAIATGRIEILSDGTPLRPLIHVKDMSRAIEWAVNRKLSDGGNNLIVNTGSNEWNFQIRELAYHVKDVIGSVDVSINRDASPDNRSYRVNFDYFKELAPKHYPVISVSEAVDGLFKGLSEIGFNDKQFRTSKYVRLNTLNRLKQKQLIDEHLKWVMKGDQK